MAESAVFDRGCCIVLRGNHVQIVCTYRMYEVHVFQVFDDIQYIQYM